MTRVLIVLAALLVTAAVALPAPDSGSDPWPDARAWRDDRPAPAAQGAREPGAPEQAAPFAAPAGKPVAIHTADLPANEASGLVASRRFPGVFYWLRDGGGATAQRPRAALWTIKLGADAHALPVRRGENFPFAQVFTAPNGDWEDVVLDDDDNLWIGDIGANDCVSEQYLYRTLEPEPDTDDPFFVTARWPVSFPDPVEGCRTRNAEAMLWLDGELYLFAKTAKSPVYRAVFPGERGAEVKLEPVAEFDAAVNKISVSTVSTDRTRLTVAGHARYWVFAADPALRGDAYLKRALRGKPVHTGTFASRVGNASVEGGSYVPGTHDLLFVAENKEMFLLPDAPAAAAAR